MKKATVIFLTTILVLTICGCGGFSEGLKDGLDDAMGKTEDAESTPEPAETVTEQTKEPEATAEYTTEPEPTTEPETKPELEETAEQQTNNLLLEVPFQTYEVKNGTGTSVIGERAEVIIDKELAKQLTKEEFLEFCTGVVKDSGYNWVTISFNDGTGIVFAGSISYVATYGEIDADGAIVNGLGYITAYSDSGEVSYTE